jgi:hypothetical protein
MDSVTFFFNMHGASKGIGICVFIMAFYLRDRDIAGVSVGSSTRA